MSRAVKFFAGLWRFIGWFWGVVVAGVAIVIIGAALTTGLSNGSALLSWPVIGPLALAALLTLCAWLAQRQQQPASPYVLKRVERLDPSIDFYVPRYVPSAYLTRPADAEARAAVRRAAQRTERSPSSEPMGVCIVGRPTQGKTRLAWEVMRAELTGWTLARWGHNLPPFDFPAQRGCRVVLAIDDIQEYAGDPNEVTTLNSLPEAFKKVDARLVIVVTCRDGDDWDNARKTLGKLLERLITVTLANITAAQADQLTALLDKAGEAVQRDQFDSTPGSLLLGVARMRDERYRDLPEPAKKLLRALKLLRSARIYDYPAPRARATAVDLCQLAEPDWQSARDALLRAGFLRLGELDEHNERALAPVADVYLEQAVPDYPAPGEDLADFWLALEQSLASHRDAAALVYLGMAFNKRPLGNLRANQQHAETCFRAALEVYTRQAAPTDWAATQNNLGMALLKQAELAEEAERAALLRQSVAFSRAALEVFPRTTLTVYWARMQVNLGTALLRQALLAEGAGRADLLEQAVTAYVEVLNTNIREVTPADWAMTQNNLSEALNQQAEVAEGRARAELLDQSIAACRAALEIHTRAAFPDEWAMTQNNLGNALQRQAKLFNESKQAAVLEQATAAYRAALEVSTRQADPATWAMVQNNLGNALYEQAEQAEDTERTMLLGQAVEAFRAALEVYTRQAAPANWAATQNNLGNTLSAQAELVEGAERLEFLGQAVIAYRTALEVNTRSAFPVFWAGAQFNLALLHVDRAAVLKEESKEAALHALQEARACVLSSQKVYTQEAMPADYRDTIKLLKRIEEAMRDLGGEPET